MHLTYACIVPAHPKPGYCRVDAACVGTTRQAGGRHGAASRSWLCALILLGSLNPLPAGAQTSATTEYQVKVAFLYNVVQFTDWPPEAFASESAPLVVGVLGTDPFGTLLDDLVRDEQVGGRPIAIQRYRTTAEIGACHVLFVSRSESGRFEEVFAALRGRSILTVGDVEGFARRGGMIRLAGERDRIRVRINLESARAAGLTLSSKLLRPAIIVATGKD